MVSYVREARGIIILEEIAGPKAGQNMFHCGRARKVLDCHDKFRVGQGATFSKFVPEELAARLPLGALGDRNLQSVVVQAGKDLSYGARVLLACNKTNDHIIKEDLAKTFVGIGIKQISQNAISKTMEVRGIISEAHAETLVLAKSQTTSIETRLLAVI